MRFDRLATLLRQSEVGNTDSNTSGSSNAKIPHAMITLDRTKEKLTMARKRRLFVGRWACVLLAAVVFGPALHAQVTVP